MCLCAEVGRRRAGDSIWHAIVPAGASAEELGQAVLDAYAAIDEWKGTHDGRGASGTPDRVQDHWTGGKEKDMGVMTVSVNRREQNPVPALCGVLGNG